MPYEWVKDNDTAPDASGAVLHSDGGHIGDPIAELHLWPHRSLPKQGFVTFFGITALLVAVPLFSVIGSPVLWGILPFIVVTFAAVWWGLQRSYSDGAILEELRLWPDRMTLHRTGPGGARKNWDANPHWVRIALHQTGGPVPNYVTLKGAGREVEIGAFLSEDERKALYAELADRLRAL